MTEDETLLRDLLAGLAMVGDWASRGPVARSFVDAPTDNQLRDRARLYYRMADAMLDVKGEA